MAGKSRIKERLLSRRGGYSIFFSENAHNDDTDNSLGSISKKWEHFQLFLVKVYEMGRSDPRHIIFGVKSGLALALVSILIFLKEPFSYISKNSIWAIFTVILVFEFSVGSTLSKGFNEALGAFFAAILALGIAQASVWWAGDWHEFVVIISIFIAGSATSYVKMHPSMKPYEYGFRVSMLTFTIVLDSGTSHFIRTAFYRFILVVVGASIADDPLCTGYRGAVQSTSQEDTLLGFATWEPPHGRYKMLRYPWGQFLKVSGALRHCTFPVMAMHGCILSEIQPAAELRMMFKKEIHMVGIEGAKVLQELGNKLEKLEKLSPCVDLLEKVHEAAEELQMLIDKKSHHLVNSDKWAGVTQQKEFEDLQDLKDEETMDSSHHIKPCHTSNHNMSINHSCFGNSEEELLQWPSRVSLLGDAILNEREVRTYESASALSLTNFTSSLIDFVARLQNLL
ncbi:aluminum-activated malate transporter 4-like protein, partial [Tanacetum coccineum]